MKSKLKIAIVCAVVTTRTVPISTTDTFGIRAVF